MNKKAQSGIGTLIIFLAMIVVAAITANVLVQTATSLQNQALTTGKQAQQTISTYAKAIAITATNGTDNNIEDFRVELKLAPGSSGIDLSKALVSFETKDGSTNFKYSSNACENHSVTGYSTDPTNHNGTFTIKYLVDGSSKKDGYLQRGDIIEICFASESSIGEDQDVTFRFAPDIGLSTVISFVTDSVLINYQERVY